MSEKTSILALGADQGADVPFDAESLRAAAIRQARLLMEYHQITAADLLVTGRQKRSRPSSQEPALKAESVVKYRHPVSGDTWDGLGSHPDWLRSALLKEGYRVAELKPENQTSAQEHESHDSGRHEAGGGFSF